MRVLAADGILPVLHLLFNPPETLLLFCIFRPLISCKLFLSPERLHPFLHIIPVAASNHCYSGNGLSAELLHMNNQICRIFQKNLVM